MNKSVIKHKKFRLAKATKISDNLFTLLEQTAILSAEEIATLKNLIVRNFANGEAEVAFEIYRKLEHLENTCVLSQIAQLFYNENQAEVLQIFQDGTKPEKKSKIKNIIPLLKVLKPNTASSQLQPDCGTGELSQVTNSSIYYNFKQRIGNGDRMFRGCIMKTILGITENIQVAVKMVDTKEVKLIQRELQVWHTLDKEDSPDTKFIVSLLEMATEETKIYFAIKWADINLHEEITVHLNPFRDRQQIIGYMKNVSTGLRWLHDQNILHRNIKPQNVLIYQYYKNERVAKLGEFGVSRPISKSEGSYSAGRGTEEWMSPEALEAKLGGEEPQDFYNTKMVDIFSLGLVFHFSLTGGEHPFTNKEGVIATADIRNLTALPNNLDCVNLACQTNLVRWMLQKSPDARPNVNQVLKHPFFWNEREQLAFLKSVASCASFKKDEFWQIIRARLDEAYQTYYRSCYNKEFDWEQKIDKMFFERKSTDYKKKYEKNCVMSLVELIRDKCEHFQDMIDDLRKLFERKEQDNNSVFCKRKYAQYFLERFPEIVIVLFCSLSSIAGKHIDCMHTLYTDYLKDYVDYAQFWQDPVVNEYLQVFRLNKEK